MNVAIAGSGLAFGRTVDDTPVFHRVGPEVAAEPYAIVGLAKVTDDGIGISIGRLLCAGACALQADESSAQGSRL